MAGNYKYPVPLVFVSDFETLTANSSYYKETHDTLIYLAHTRLIEIKYERGNKKLKIQPRYVKGIEEDKHALFKPSFHFNIKEYLDYLFSYGNIHKTYFIVYFHNLSGFDIHFILGYLYDQDDYAEMNALSDDIRASNVNSFLLTKSSHFTKLSIKKWYSDSRYRIIEFRDSKYIFKDSILNLGNSLNKAYNTNIYTKPDFDMNKTNYPFKSMKEFDTKANEDIKIRVESDTLILARWIEIFITSNYLCGYGSFIPDTLPAAAKKQFLSLKKLCKPKHYLIFHAKTKEDRWKIQDEVNIFFSMNEIYRGGITSLNKAYISKDQYNLKSLDINSSYPYAMNTYKMPVGAHTMIESSNWNYLKSFRKSNCYVFMIFKNIKQINTSVPPFIFKRMPGTWSTTYHYELPFFKIYSLLDEVELYVKHCTYDSYTIEEAFYFKENAYIFDDYIEKFMSLKIESSKNGDIINKQIAKLLLNSLYGKFGEKIFHEVQISKVYYNSHKEEFANEVMVTKRSISDEKPLDEMLYVRFEKETNSHFSFLPVAATVTSWARIKLMDAAFKTKANIYYCDTDSLKMDLKANIDHLKIDDNELGAWKDENHYDIFKTLGPKKWIAKIKDSDELSFASGGIRREFIKIKGYEYFNDSATYPNLEKLKTKHGIILKDSIKKLINDV